MSTLARESVVEAPDGRPKYDLICDQVRRQIMAGELQPGMRLPPERKLPELWGASLQTTRVVLGKLVREGLVVRRHGSGTYVTDRRYPELVPGRSLRVGILWHHRIEPVDFGATLWGQTIRGIFGVLHLDEQAAHWPKVRPGRSCRVHFKRRDNSVQAVCLGETDISQVRHPPLDEVREGCFDGLIAVGIIETGWLEQLVALGIPTVLVDHLNDRFDLRADQVYFDPGPGYRAAVQHCVAQGCARIHFVGGLTSLPAPSPLMNQEEVRKYRAGRRRIDPDSFLRLSACRQAMDACGLAMPDDCVHHLVQDPGSTNEWARRILAAPEAAEPDAVLCHSSAQANLVREAFRLAGREPLVFGTAAAPEPGGVIRADAEHMGATAAELLVSHWQRPGRRALRVGVPMEFVPPSSGKLEETQTCLPATAR